jgi:hypothetical protein
MAGDVAQWLSVWLACIRPSVWSSVPQKKEKKKKRIYTIGKHERQLKPLAIREMHEKKNHIEMLPHTY